MLIQSHILTEASSLWASRFWVTPLTSLPRGPARLVPVRINRPRAARPFMMAVSEVVNGGKLREDA